MKDLSSYIQENENSHNVHFYKYWLNRQQTDNIKIGDKVWRLKRISRYGKTFYTPVLTEVEDKKMTTIIHIDKSKSEIMSYKVKGTKQFLLGGVFLSKEDALAYCGEMDLKIW